MKGWVSSKTLWFNVLAAGVTVLMNSAGTAAIDPMWQALIITGGNFALRFLTSKSIKVGSPLSS